MSKGRMLVVEDEAIVAADLAGKLARLGYQISGTTSLAEEAIELARECRPDLILMDIRLAGEMDGIEAAEVIRREFDVPVIFLTAHSDRATLERAKLAEPFGYLLKPFDHLSLETHIEMALYKHRAERRLRQAHDELEARVEERTRELQEAEKKLRASNETLELRVAERTAKLLTANHRLDLLAYSASQLLESEEPQLLVDSLCQRVMVHLQCDVFFNFLIDENKEHLHLNACAGINEEVTEQCRTLQYGVAVCGCAARDATRIVAERIQESHDPRTELVKSMGIVAYACHPLMVQGRVLGTLSFGTRTRESFSADDLSLMKAVADQVAIAMDRMQMVEKLRRAKHEAEEASRTKSQFLANMSHELRTPMTGVLGMLDLALQSTCSVQQAECIQTAYRSSKSLLRILNDILDLAKVEAGKFSLDQKPFSLRTMVTETMEILIPEARRKGLDLDLSIGEDLPDHLQGDQIRLRQVLTNLVGNALKFTDRGRVEVEVAREESGAEGIVEARFTVIDTGIGIPQDKQHLLFQSFSQVDGSHTRSYGGTGLGLAISKEIVERMGGAIAFESEEGKGSSFTFTARLEVAAGEMAETKPARPEVEPAEQGLRGSGGQRHLLITEDDATIRQVLGTMLAMLEYRVDFAEDGVRAIEMWERGNYDMILMDVQMPRLDGFRATEAIREREGGRGCRIPIIAMTAHAMKEDEQRCIAAGMDDYISKPIDFQECLRKITALLDCN